MTNNRINNGDESGGNLEYFDTETRLNALPKPGSCPFSRAWLYDLYWVQKKSCPEIGIIAGEANDRKYYGGSTVAAWMKYYKIRKRTMKEVSSTYKNYLKGSESSKVSEKVKQAAIRNVKKCHTESCIRDSRIKIGKIRTLKYTKFIKCDFCEAVFKRQLSKIKARNNFCSKSCSAKFMRKKQKETLELNGKYIGYKLIPCTYCEKLYWANRNVVSAAQRGEGNPFCSTKCRGLYQRRKNQIAKQKAGAESQQVQPTGSSTPADNITDPADPENLTEGIL